jgi:hypothetical protein
MILVSSLSSVLLVGFLFFAWVIGIPGMSILMRYCVGR